MAIKKLIIDWKMTPQKVYGIVCTNLISVFFLKINCVALSKYLKQPSRTSTFLQEAKFDVESMFEEPMPEFKNIYFQLITESYEKYNCVQVWNCNYATRLLVHLFTKWSIKIESKLCFFIWGKLSKGIWCYKIVQGRIPIYGNLED